MDKNNIEFNGTSNSIIDFFGLLVVLVILPLLFGSSVSYLIVFYLIEMMFFFFYLKIAYYSIEIKNGILIKKRFLEREGACFEMSKDNVYKVYFGFPSIKGMPVVKIHFRSPPDQIKIVTIDSEFLKKLYVFFIDNGVDCEVFPESAKKRLK